MQTDRTTKALLALIAPALFLNVFVPLLQPTVVNAQNRALEFDVERIEGSVQEMGGAFFASLVWQNRFAMCSFCTLKFAAPADSVRISLGPASKTSLALESRPHSAFCPEQGVIGRIRYGGEST